MGPGNPAPGLYPAFWAGVGLFAEVPSISWRKYSPACRSVGCLFIWARSRSIKPLGNRWMCTVDGSQCPTLVSKSKSIWLRPVSPYLLFGLLGAGLPPGGEYCCWLKKFSESVKPGFHQEHNSRMRVQGAVKDTMAG